MARWREHASGASLHVLVTHIFPTLPCNC